MIHSLIQFITQHQFMAGLVSMAVVNCAVTTMPSPKPDSSEFYVWLFNFSHAVVLSLSRIFAQYKNGNGVPH
jgi:hypothetical protein